MGQILVRRLDDDVKARLRERAGRNGRSLEAEVRAVLEDAARSEGEIAQASKFGWGTRLLEAQAGGRSTPDDWDTLDASLREVRDERARAINFEE